MERGCSGESQSASFERYLLTLRFRIVEGGKYKASFLLPDHGDGAPDKSDGLLISETVVPGFVYSDHDFMKKERLEALVTAEEAKTLEWLLKKE